MDTSTIPQKHIYLSIPQSDYRLISSLSRKMGWTIHHKRKSGLELALEDIAAGRVYKAEDGADLINQCRILGGAYSTGLVDSLGTK